MKPKEHGLEEIARLRKYLRVGEDGLLYWIEQTCSRFPIGSPAGFLHRATGYRRVTVDGVHHQAHRVVFALTHGRWPVGDLDHISGDKGDNRPQNLREATRSQNCFNRRRSRRNKTGVKGVRRNPSGTWTPCLTVKGRRMEFGTFDDLELADLVRQEAARIYHGEYARAA